MVPEAVVMAASISLPRSPFRVASQWVHTDPDEYNDIAAKSFAAKQHFDAGIYSDPIAGIRLYMAWAKIAGASEGGGVGVDAAGGSGIGCGGAKFKAFCRKHSLAEPRMRMFVQQVNNLTRAI